MCPKCERPQEFCKCGAVHAWESHNPEIQQVLRYLQDHNVALQAHNDVLVAALKPFVEAWDEAEEGDEILTNLDPGLDVNIAVRIKHWLAAKSALSHPAIQARQDALRELVEAWKCGPHPERLARAIEKVVGNSKV